MVRSGIAVSDPVGAGDSESGVVEGRIVSSICCTVETGLTELSTNSAPVLFAAVCASASISSDGTVFDLLLAYRVVIDSQKGGRVDGEVALDHRSRVAEGVGGGAGATVFGPAVIWYWPLGSDVGSNVPRRVPLTATPEPAQRGGSMTRASSRRAVPSFPS